MRELIAQIAKLELEAAELRKDKARLDWLDANPDIYFARVGSAVELLTTDHDFMQDPTFANGTTLRHAVDAAMEKLCPASK